MGTSPAAVSTGTGCLIGEYINDESRHYQDVEGEPLFLQSELVWEATQQSGSRLCMRHYASEGGSVGPRLDPDACGTSPQVQKAEHAYLNESAVGTLRGIERAVWVDQWQGHPSAGVAIDQRFAVFTHLFYNMVAQPEWLFVEDGAHPVP